MHSTIRKPLSTSDSLFNLYLIFCILHDVLIILYSNHEKIWNWDLFYCKLDYRIYINNIIILYYNILRKNDREINKTISMLYHQEFTRILCKILDNGEYLGWWEFEIAHDGYRMINTTFQQGFQHTKHYDLRFSFRPFFHQLPLLTVPALFLISLCSFTLSNVHIPQIFPPYYGNSRVGRERNHRNRI